MKKLGIIGAMDVEVETLKEKMTDKTVTNLAAMEFCEGFLEGMPAVICRCGVGKVNAAMCAQILCTHFCVTHLVNTGVAGSLSTELEIGDLLVSQDAIYHDFDCNAFDYPVCKVPGMDVIAFPADENMIELAVAAAEGTHSGRVKLGRVATGDQFICTNAQKQAVAARTQGLCTEMEGAAIAHTAYRNGVPFVILRIISDKADETVAINYNDFEAEAAHRCAAVTERLAALLQKRDV